VAGFNAVVLEATSAGALVKWLNQRGYFFSPEVQAWVEPYVKQNWKITALKVAKGKDGTQGTNVAAAALRMTFKTDRPLFPYREPDSKSAAGSLGASNRLLRVYFLSDVRYDGELGNGGGWSGKAVWSNRLSDGDRGKLLEKLKLPAATGPRTFWLTEFEDEWAYADAPGDVYFSKARNQATLKRPPIIQYTSSLWSSDPAVYGLIAVFVIFPFVRKFRRRRGAA
jgi:hypothetical protein